MDATLYPYTTFNITGACNGPLYITTDGTRFVGDGVATSSIVLPAGAPNPENGAVSVSGGSDVRFQDLTLDASAWADMAADGSDASGLYVRDGFARLIDVNVTGGIYAVNPYRNAILRLEGDINITGWVNEGLSVGDQSTVQLRGSSPTLTVTSANTTASSISDSYMIAVNAYRLGQFELRGTVTATVPSGYNALDARNGSYVRFRNGGTLNGHVEIYGNTSVNMNNVTVNGRIDVVDGSTLGFGNSVKDSTNEMTARNNSTINISSSSTINDAIVSANSSTINVESSTLTDGIEAEGSSVINLTDVTYTATVSGIESRENSYIQASGTTSLNPFSSITISSRGILKLNEDASVASGNTINIDSGGYLVASEDADFNNSPINCTSRADNVFISSTLDDNVTGVTYGTCP